MGSRQWGQWTKRSFKELKETSGVVGLGGIALTAVGGFAAAPALLIGGAVVVGGATVWAGWRGIPPKLSSPEDLVGRVLRLEELRAHTVLNRSMMALLTQNTI